MSEEDRCEVTKGVWFVNSPHKTSSDLSKWLAFPAVRQGIVVSAKYFAGFASSDIDQGDVRAHQDRQGRTNGLIRVTELPCRTIQPSTPTGVRLVLL